MSQAGLINFEGSDPQIPTTFVTDDGNAVPIANTLELLATTVPAQSIPIQTVGSGNTVTIETQFASSSAASDATQVGFAAFDSADFNVDSNGFVSLAVTPMDNIQSIQVDNATAPGVNPVEPDGSGILTVSGNYVANHAVPIETHSRALNEFNVEVQLASSNATTNPLLSGLAHFNSTQFSVDANGFVELAGGGLAVDSIALQAGTSPVVPTAAGLVTFNGSTVAAGTNPVRTNGTGANTYALEVQLSQALAATDATKVGLCNFNSTQFSVDANGFVELVGGGLAVDSIGVQATSGTGTDPVLPTAAGVIEFEGSTVAAGTNPVRAVSTAANTVQIQNQISQALAATDATKIGLSNFNSTYFSVDANGFVSLTSAATTDLHDTRFIVSAGGSSDGANYTTIASAITAATSAGGVQTIMIQPGTYTENLTLPANINLVAHVADAFTPTVTITGKITCSDAGSRSISGIRLKTNSDFCLVVSGSVATVVHLVECFIQASNNTAISYTSSSSSSQVNLYRCNGNLDTTGISYLSSSGSGTVNIDYCRLLNTGGSITASTSSAGTIQFRHTQYGSPLTTSGTAAVGGAWTNLQFSSLNVTALTAGGSGTHRFAHSRFISDTASAISISSGTTLSLTDCEIFSSNTNAITGTGTLQFGNLTFSGSSSTINTTTQTAVYSDLGKSKATKQPAFLVDNNIGRTDVTGDGTVYTLIFNREIFDQDNNFDGTSTFTAPITGRYYLQASVLFNGIINTHTQGNITIATSNNNYSWRQHPFNTCDLNASLTLCNNVLADMDAGDTCTITVSISGGTKVVDISAANSFTRFSGNLEC